MQNYPTCREYTEQWILTFASQVILNVGMDSDLCSQKFISLCSPPILQKNNPTNRVINQNYKLTFICLIWFFTSHQQSFS